MLIFPIINKGKVFNVEVELKTATKIATRVSDFNLGPSDIMIHNLRYSDSYYNYKTSTPQSVIDFIRTNSKVGKGEILISTKAHDDGTYDIYSMPMPLGQVSEGLDNLLGAAILNIKNKSDNEKGHYLDFNKLLIFNLITESKLNDVKYLSENMTTTNISKYIEEHGLRDLFKIFDVINEFSFTVIDGSVMLEEKLLDTLKFLEPTKSKDFNNLLKYYNLARNNQLEYAKLSKFNRMVNNQALNLIQNKKEKVKRISDLKDEAA